uniref:Interleukin-15 receptor subunit alpha n=1 Tax=Microcebus murinus TaxID=30608 RepID=A0A8C5YAB3_MICMU
GRPRRADGCRKRLFTAAVFSSLPSTLTGITCPTPTSVEHAGIRVKSYSVHSRERYVCNSGFKRKAGTSSLTQCMFNETTQTAHWTAPNLKCITSSPGADTTVAAETAVAPHSPSKPPSAGPPGPGGQESSQAPSQTTAVGTSEGTPSAPRQPPGHSEPSSTSPSLLCVAGVALLAPCCLQSRQSSRPNNVEMATVEAQPMTSSREEDAETGPHAL